ncbi:hypothetical protein D3C75_930800 [compost metagenome]
MHEGAIYPTALPSCPKLPAYFDTDFFDHVLGQRAVLQEQHHHVGPDFLGAQRRNPNRHLNQLVEVAGDEDIVGHAAKMLAYGVLDHFVVSGNHECRVAQEQEEPNGFQSRNRRFRQAAIQVVDQHDKSHP